MRFNSRELALLAGRKSEYFDKEGVLSVSDKNEFKKNKREKVLSEKFCRLKGNLLFIFKGKEKPSADAASKVEIYVLEQTTITKNCDRYSFTIAFPGDDKSLIFTCSNHLEQCDWVSVLQNASYETLRLKLKTLRQDIIKKTGVDPLLLTTQNHVSDVNRSSRQSAFDEDSVLEMCLSCNDLTSPLESRAPNSFVAISYMSPPQSYWTKHTQTEIIENCSNPHFMTYIVFNKDCNIHESTQIKLSVYDIKDRNNGTTLHLGNSVLTVQRVFQPEPVTLPLMSHDGEADGSITVLSWQSITCDSSSSDNDSEENHLSLETDGTKSQGAVSNPPLLSHSLSSNTDPNLRHQELLLLGHNSPWMNTRNSLGRTKGNNIYGKIVTRKYRFPTSEIGRTLSVIEYMAESTMSVLVPKLYLKILVEEERESLAGLERLGRLRGQWAILTAELMKHHQTLIEVYTGVHEYLTAHYRGEYFKPSIHKADPRLEFLPVNLHVARLRVLESQQSLDRCYDIITCGALTAYTVKTKHGLKKALELAGCTTGEVTPTPGGGGLEFASPSWLIGTTAERKKPSTGKNEPWVDAMRVCKDVGECCRQLSQILSERKLGRLNNHTKLFTTKINELLSVVSNSVIGGVVRCYEEACEINQSECLDQGTPLLTTLCNCINKNATTMLSVLIALTDTADQVIGQTYLQQLKECLCDFENNFKNLQKLLKNAQTLISLQIKHEFLCGAMENIQHRRDIVFSQALSVCVCGFMTMLHSYYEDPQIMLQLSSAGLVVHFESLLSTYGEDVAKLEDMYVGVNDLNKVKFIVVLLSESSNWRPISLQGRRDNLTVVVHVEQDIFSQLPNSLKSGRHIDVRPVLFTVGINEQQTIADKIGDTSVQDQINYNSFIHITGYFNEVKNMLKCDSAATVETLLPLLYSEIISRRNKNVKILHLAQEICREMNSVRLTSCKSGKDRTAMAVTLEFCHLLTAKHDLSEHEFRHALDCLRSNGTRLENTLKNTGSASYAFNNLQLQLFPKDYRPPEGTYGNITT